jgi:ribose-phosphate pyrophosphokinase
MSNNPLYIGLIDIAESNETIEIVSRFNSFLDLELILCATQCLRLRGINNIVLTIPYFLGGRSDRVFTDDGIHYIRDIVAPIINSQNYKMVRVLDPHSDVIQACIKNFKELQTSFRIKSFQSFLTDNQKTISDILFVIPDSGAKKKFFTLDIYQYIKRIGGDINIVSADKMRDIKTGNIISTVINIPEEYKNKDIFIIDDICDGGRTFIELANKIKENGHQGTMNLMVTHGIFSKGIDIVAEYFDNIYTTNSIQEIKHNKVTQFNIF